MSTMSALMDRVSGIEELGLGEHAESEILEAVEEARVEVAELAAEIEENSDVVEELVEVVADLDESVEELEEIVEGVESLLGSGSYNAKAFGMIYDRGQRLNEKLGGESGDRLGAESLADKATAEMAARNGLEGFVDTIKKYGQQAIEFVKHIFNAMITFFVSLFNQADGLERRANGLKTRVEKADKVKEKISLGAWNAHFDYAKNGLNGAETKGSIDAISGIGELLAVAKSVDGVTVAAFNTAYDKVKAGAKAGASAFGRAEQKKAGKEAVSIAQEAAIRYRFAYQDEAVKDLAGIAGAARALKLVISKDAALAKKLSTGETKSKVDKAALLKALTEVHADVKTLRDGKVGKAFGAAERDRIVGNLQTAAKTSDEEKAKEIAEQIKGVRAIYSAAAQVGQAGARAAAAAAKAKLDAVSAHV